MMQLKFVSTCYLLPGSLGWAKSLRLALRNTQLIIGVSVYNDLASWERLFAICLRTSEVRISILRLDFFISIMPRAASCSPANSTRPDLI